MKLREGAFERIRSGKKRIEVRLFDEKRRQLRIGDTIRFAKLPELTEQVTVEVAGLLRYATFAELLGDFRMAWFGLSDDFSQQAFLDSIYGIYTKEEEAKFGVLGIVIRLR